MKINSIKFLSIVLSIALLINGCEKNLNQVNPNQQTNQSFWKTDKDALAGVNATYSTLIEDGTFMRMTPALSDAR
jgi:hypothetical protein